ncbi:hypothetical protein [Thauera aromatica]|uniref:hypothetical protein n=1 Tax=Thauera aromatica TaxID=59405 RepID=UPI001FFC6AEF|nr:hypothetical protein [Thauera aromatica]MCK2097075.1 hypothetical protein [Thauera aromatica]
MKAHIGVDVDSGLVRTAANVADVTQAQVRTRLRQAPGHQDGLNYWEQIVAKKGDYLLMSFAH